MTDGIAELYEDEGMSPYSRHLVAWRKARDIIDPSELEPELSIAMDLLTGMKVEKKSDIARILAWYMKQGSER